IAQQPKASLTEDLPGHFADDAVDRINEAVVGTNRVVRDVEIGLLGKAVALDEEWDRLGGERLAAMDDLGKGRTKERRPDLLPAFTRWLAERPWMLAAERGNVGIVINRPEFRPPEEDDLGFRGEEQAYRVLQRTWPVAWGTERCRHPVEG